MKLRFDYFQNRSINFESRHFKYSDSHMRFHNHFLINNDLLYMYFNKCKKVCEKLSNISSLVDLKLFIDSTQNADVLDSNHNIERTIVVLEKYGLKRRFIIKEILNGTNDKIEFTNKSGEEELISPLLIDAQNNLLFKIPIHIKGDNNNVRIIFIAKNLHDELNYFPLFIDPHHLAYSASKYEKLPKVKDVFQKIVSNHLKNIFDYKK